MASRAGLLKTCRVCGMLVAEKTFFDYFPVTTTHFKGVGKVKELARVKKRER